jgi:hypothetical protein
VTHLCKKTDFHVAPYVPIIKEGRVQCFYCGKNLPIKALEYAPKHLLERVK